MNTQTFLEEAAKLERLLYCVAWSMLSNSDDCADAVQETLMRAWQSRDTLRNLRSFRPWITRIMVNTCNTMLRKRLNQRWVPLEEDMAVLDAPQDSGFDLDEKHPNFWPPFGACRTSCMRWWCSTIWKGTRCARSPQCSASPPARSKRA